MKKILIVDDSLMIHTMLKKTLENQGYKVCGEAKNGKEGVELFASCSPDIIFMDITMPVMDGIEATKIIRERNKDVKIIMLTAMGDDEICCKSIGAGVDLFLKKPFNAQKILNAILEIDKVG